MLYKLEIENFASIRELQSLDLRASKTDFVEKFRLEPIGRGNAEMVPKVVALFGANASGKSNVLRALSFVAWFIHGSFSNAPDAFLPFTRFLDNEKQDAPCRIAIWFTGPSDPSKFEKKEGKACRYVYEVCFDGSRTAPQYVRSEKLRFWPHKTNRPVTLFSRDARCSVNGNKVFGLGGYKGTLEKILRTNVSVISTLAQLKHPFATELWRACSSVSSNILMQKEDLNDQSLIKVYRSNASMFAELNKHIQRLDLGIEEVHFVEGLEGGTMAMCRHTGLSNSLILPLESHGTKQFIRTFPLLYAAMQNGGIAVIDELDLSIHPSVLPEILRWFYDSSTNPHGAQLWFTAQTPSLMDDLSKEEIFFCEKDSGGRTSVYALRQVQAVRKDDNFYRKYMGGVYGAVPQVG